ncbi:hypothetical protein MIMGU_mgv1a014180mg [Erythranthe guttata]|uniref:Uncharacterized protein n=1 Tax=Erythranthe guttata TaxID=4155 RepID=A0A022QPP6_ERYGU|nr:hypothetical protein MIMGU_mgv1a014180mg [Erythranthe guttata]
MYTKSLLSPTESKYDPKLGNWTISLSSSSDSVDRSTEETRDDSDEEDDEVVVDGDGKSSNFSIAAAFAAAAWTSGKLRVAEAPLMLSAATSWARAAISGVGKVPSHIRDFLRGSRISETHLPQLLIRTPRYTGCLLLLLAVAVLSRILLIFLPDSGATAAAACPFAAASSRCRDCVWDKINDDDDNKFENNSLSPELV